MAFSRTAREAIRIRFSSRRILREMARTCRIWLRSCLVASNNHLISNSRKKGMHKAWHQCGHKYQLKGGVLQCLGDCSHDLLWSLNEGGNDPGFTPKMAYNAA